MSGDRDVKSAARGRIASAVVVFIIVVIFILKTISAANEEERLLWFIALLGYMILWAIDNLDKKIDALAGKGGR